MLHPVAPTDLYLCWEWVREGLAKTTAKTGDDWMPEDVYHELKSGASHLYLIYVGAERVGFCVLQKWDRYHAGPRLFVRALWCLPGALVKHRPELEAELNDLAIKCGCVALRMTSPRRWELAGWTPKQTIYEKEVR